MNFQKKDVEVTPEPCGMVTMDLAKKLVEPVVPSHRRSK